MRKKDGFILEHLLISIFIITLFLPISLQAVELMKQNLIQHSMIQDILSINQIREILMFSYQIDVHNSHLTFRYQNEIRVLEQVGDKLIMKKGTVIYLTKLDDLHFFQEDQMIFLSYRRDKKMYQKVLCHV